MIIGKDKERVRQLEIEAKLAKELITAIRSDLEVIAKDLREKELVDTTSVPYYKLYEDIGRCSGHLWQYRKS